MRKIRIYVSCITEKKCRAFREASISVQPLNEPICKELNTLDVLKIGSSALKKDGFVLTRGIQDV